MRMYRIVSEMEIDHLRSRFRDGDINERFIKDMLIDHIQNMDIQGIMFGFNLEYNITHLPTHRQREYQIRTSESGCYTPTIIREEPNPMKHKFI